MVNTMSSDAGVKVKTADADCSPLDRLNVWGGGKGPAVAAPYKPSRAQPPTQWPAHRRISFPSSSAAFQARPSLLMGQLVVPVWDFRVESNIHTAEPAGSNPKNKATNPISYNSLSSRRLATPSLMPQTSATFMEPLRHGVCTKELDESRPAEKLIAEQMRIHNGSAEYFQRRGLGWDRRITASPFQWTG